MDKANDMRESMNEWQDRILRKRSEPLTEAEFSTLRFNALLLTLANTGAIDKHKFIDILIQISGGVDCLHDATMVQRIDDCMRFMSWGEALRQVEPAWDPSFKFVPPNT
ncbi:MAG TPA: hypothetical protein VEF76_10450 [Patescibacteria group bacterium]|nr:hypothetical protein [Patescibacteria group bacterium]